LQVRSKLNPEICKPASFAAKAPVQVREWLSRVEQLKIVAFE
jgi:hypothetical protein